MRRKGHQKDNFVNQWPQACRPAVGFNDCGMGPNVDLSSFSLSNVLGKFIVNYSSFYRRMLVSVRQFHDISLWSILSLGNRLINVEMIYKLRVFDINWCLITLIIYVQTLKRLFGELTWGYVCLTMSLHWFRFWLGAAYTTHYCINKWWHKPTMYMYASLGRRILTHGGQSKMATIFLTTQIA